MKINEVTLTEGKFLNEQEVLLEFLPILFAGAALWEMLSAFLIGMSIAEIYQILEKHDFDIETMSEEDWTEVLIDVVMLAVPGAGKMGAKALKRVIPGNFLAKASMKLRNFFRKKISSESKPGPKPQTSLAKKAVNAVGSAAKTVAKTAASVAGKGMKTAANVGAAGAGAYVGYQHGGVGGAIAGKSSGGLQASPLPANLAKIEQDFNSYPLTITFDRKNPKIMIVNGSPVTDAQGYQKVGNSTIKNIKDIARAIKKNDPTTMIPKKPGADYRT